MQVNIACINSHAQTEIKSFLSKKNIDVKDILKAYIQKTQDYAELEDKMAELITKIDVYGLE